jgi:hypothetical protein
MERSLGHAEEEVQRSADWKFLRQIKWREVYRRRRPAGNREYSCSSVDVWPFGASCLTDWRSAPRNVALHQPCPCRRRCANAGHYCSGIAARLLWLSSDQVTAGRGRMGRGCDRVQRICHREGLKMPRKPRPRGRLRYVNLLRQPRRRNRGLSTNIPLGSFDGGRSPST